MSPNNSALQPCDCCQNRGYLSVCSNKALADNMETIKNMARPVNMPDGGDVPTYQEIAEEAQRRCRMAEFKDAATVAIEVANPHQKYFDGAEMDFHIMVQHMIAALEAYAESVIAARMPSEEEITRAAFMHEWAGPFEEGAQWLRSRLEGK